ncbi:PLP-dependent aminotransferase family protein [Marinobacterium sp. YM272]|uniref:aminotransferase-like domain-containing protein n=1 Tax=Marinobacterium sp. YM272 TaxID=3421654 RepID=UPI003D7FB29F
MNIQEKARARASWLPSDQPPPGPRYKSLADQIASAIACGELKAGERLPPQRLLADALEVTVGTITRAYKEAERRGLVEAKVGSGTRVKGKSSDEPKFHHLSRATADSVDLSLSIPIPSPLRERQFSAIMSRLSERPEALHNALEYQSEQGSLEQREQLATWLRGQAINVDPSELLLSIGGQHADFLVLQALVRPGEAVASDALTYPGMIACARQLGLKHLPVSMDREGMRPDALERLCQRQRVRLLYLMPEHNNPTAAQMSEQRRREIVEIARRYDLLILEDGVQFVTRELRGTPFFELAPERAFYIFSVSKILSGGLRFGCLRAPAALIPQLAASLRAQFWSSPGVVGALACEWLASGDADSLISWQNRELSARHALLEKLFDGYDFHAHPCGFHAWLHLPEPWRASDFVEQARLRGVTLVSPEPFCVGSQPAPQAVRICITPPASIEALETGLTRLRELLAEGPRSAAPLV